MCGNDEGKRTHQHAVWCPYNMINFIQHTLKGMPWVSDSESLKSIYDLRYSCTQYHAMLHCVIMTPDSRIHVYDKKNVDCIGEQFIRSRMFCVGVYIYRYQHNVRVSTFNRDSTHIVSFLARHNAPKMTHRLVVSSVLFVLWLWHNNICAIHFITRTILHRHGNSDTKRQ